VGHHVHEKGVTRCEIGRLALKVQRVLEQQAVRSEALVWLGRRTKEEVSKYLGRDGLDSAVKVAAPGNLQMPLVRAHEVHGELLEALDVLDIVATRTRAINGRRGKNELWQVPVNLTEERVRPHKQNVSSFNGHLVSS